MPLTGIPAAIAADPKLERVLESAFSDADLSCVEGARVPLLAALLRAEHAPRALLAIVATGREADGVVDAFRAYLPEAQVHAFPSWETLPHERLSPSAETVGRRLGALRALRAWRASARPAASLSGPDAGSPGERSESKGPFVLVASVRAALQPLLPGLDAIEPV
ncbi:MAG: transcription-repair coupling factor, partial [Microbacteriaceae bacterium]|nr:transcription-repair coupling factor [Microbacteriaceae bacterium]